jgi:Trp operon repressor
MSEYTKLDNDVTFMELEIERLTIENKLLRAASKEQRELNGTLRVEMNKILDGSHPVTQYAMYCKDVL